MKGDHLAIGRDLGPYLPAYILRNIKLSARISLHPVYLSVIPRGSKKQPLSVSRDRDCPSVTAQRRKSTSFWSLSASGCCWYRMIQVNEAIGYAPLPGAFTIATLPARQAFSR